MIKKSIFIVSLLFVTPILASQFEVIREIKHQPIRLEFRYWEVDQKEKYRNRASSKVEFKGAEIKRGGFNFQVYEWSHHIDDKISYEVELVGWRKNTFLEMILGSFGLSHQQWVLTYGAYITIPKGESKRRYALCEGVFIPNSIEEFFILVDEKIKICSHIKDDKIMAEHAISIKSF